MEWKVAVVVLVVLVPFSVGLCPNDCSDNGDCFEDHCECDLKYTGEDCSKLWEDLKGFDETLAVYCSLTIFLMIIVGVFSSWQLYLVFKNKDKLLKKYKWNLVTYINTLVLISAIVRIVDSAIDPVGLRGIFPGVISNILGSIPIILWLVVSYMLVMYWVELTHFVGELTFVRKMKPVLFSVIAGLTLMFLVLSALAVIDVVFHVLESLFIVLNLVVILVMSGIYGLRLRSRLNASANLAQSEVTVKFIRELTTFIVIFHVSFVCIVLAILALIAAPNDPWLFFILHTLTDVFAFIAIMAMLLLLRKKKPKQLKSTTSEK